MLAQGLDKRARNNEMMTGLLYDDKKAPSAILESNEKLRNYLMDGYTAINDGMRDGTPLSDEQTDVLWEMMDLMQDMNESVVLYRGMPIANPIDKLEVGQVIPSNSFMSTSRFPMVADNFSTGITMMEIHTTPDTEAITVPNHMHPYGEGETILNVDQKFRVKEIRKNVEEGEIDYSLYLVLELTTDTPTQSEIKLSKTGEGTDWTRRHGLEFDEELHRWVLPESYDSGSAMQREVMQDALIEAIEAYREQDYITAIEKLGDVWYTGMSMDTPYGDSVSERAQELTELVHQRADAERDELASSGASISEWNFADEGWDLVREQASRFHPWLQPSFHPIREGDIVDRYVGVRYRAINGYLREPEKYKQQWLEREWQSSVPDDIRALSGVMYQMKEPQVLYRGIKHEVNTPYFTAEEGDIITNDGFMSGDS